MLSLEMRVKVERKKRVKVEVVLWRVTMCELFYHFIQGKFTKPVKGKICIDLFYLGCHQCPIFERTKLKFYILIYCLLVISLTNGSEAYLQLALQLKPLLVVLTL